MDKHAAEACRHSWRYYVDLASRGVRIRRCESCGEVRPVGVVSLEALPLSA